LSSTTDRSAERGQILVLFAGGLVALLLVAALAFDVGMILLERRDQQNAADAAALAGARYVDPTQTFHGSCAAPSGNDAVIAACEVALANDFSDTASDEDVFVDIPPIHAEEAAHRAPWFIEVRIAASRPSLFAGVIGKAAWPVGVMAIAANQQDVLYPFGMLALSETACKAMQFAGTGVVDVASSIQSNSTGEDCPPPDQIAFSQTGGAQVDADGVCRAAGDIQDSGIGYLHCSEEQPFSFPVPDPLRNLEAPPAPPLAAPIKRWVGGILTSPASTDIPDYCPGKTTPANRAPEADDPRLCTMGSSSDGSAGGVFVMSPGLYPGGLEIKGGVTVYLLPGIYWIGGGGFAVAGDSTVISVKDETDTTPAVCTEGATPPCDDGGGGILIYNSKLSSSGPGAPKPITIGGGGGTVSLMPYLYPFPDNPDGSGVVELVIWQDRTVALGGDDVTLNGSTATATAVRGVIYLPNGDLKINGSASEFTMDQVIAQTFYVSGSGGTIKVLEEMGVDAVFSAAGLVE
jgi:hypothetical protein